MWFLENVTVMQQPLGGWTPLTLFGGLCESLMQDIGRGLSGHGSLESFLLCFSVFYQEIRAISVIL